MTHLVSEKPAEPILQISGLEVIYQRAITAIQGVSISVARNSITALVGTNGAGKSTTMRMLTGFLPPSSGRISSQGRGDWSELPM